MLKEVLNGSTGGQREVATDVKMLFAVRTRLLRASKVASIVGVAAPMPTSRAQL